MITLDQLRVLDAVAETGSVTAAAARLHRAQSAVSYGLKALEGVLGLTLVDRSGYRARLTPEGEAVLRQGRTALNAADAVETLAGELRGGSEPQLSVLVDAILPTGQVMPVLRELLAAGFPTRIDLRVELLGRMTQALKQWRPALALGMRGMAAVAPEYEQETVGTLTMVPVVAAEHPLARHPAPIPLEVMRQHPHIVITSPPELRTPVDTGLIGAPVQWTVPDFQTRLEALRAGLGFAWMPTYLVAADLAAGRLAALRLERGSVQRGEVALFYRRQPPLGRTGRFLLELLRHHGEIVPPVPPDLREGYAES